MQRDKKEALSTSHCYINSDVILGTFEGPLHLSKGDKQA